LLGLEDGAVWWATFIPGEGIESEPRGPSKLVRIGQDGSQSVVATSDSVINQVVANFGYVAYATEGGTYQVVDSRDWNGQGVPLLWLSGGKLLVIKGTSLHIQDGNDDHRVSGTISDVPESAVVVE
jgi:hypothetical protein